MIENTEHGDYRIKNAKSGQYIAVGWGEINNGGQLVQFPDVGQNDINWHIHHDRHGYYNVINRNSRKYMAVSGGSHNEGARVIQWDNVGQTDVKWRIREVIDRDYDRCHIWADIRCGRKNSRLINYGFNPDNECIFRCERDNETITHSTIKRKSKNFQTVDIKIGTLLPTRLVRGNREFNGGPYIVSNVNLRTSEDNRSLIADVYFFAQETKDDWSTTEQSWPLEVWRAPAKARITRIITDTFSETRYRGTDSDYQILGPGPFGGKAVGPLIEGLLALGLGTGIGETLTLLQSGLQNLSDHGNTVDVTGPKGNIHTELVRAFGIVGDTGGNDISRDSNPKDDTRIVSIEFNPVEIELAY